MFFREFCGNYTASNPNYTASNTNYTTSNTNYTTSNPNHKQRYSKHRTYKQKAYKLCTNCLGDICILRLNTLRKFLMSPKPHISATLTTLVWPSLNACTALYTL